MESKYIRFDCATTFTKRYLPGSMAYRKMGSYHVYKPAGTHGRLYQRVSGPKTRKATQYIQQGGPGTQYFKKPRGLALTKIMSSNIPRSGSVMRIVGTGGDDEGGDPQGFNPIAMEMSQSPTGSPSDIPPIVPKTQPENNYVDQTFEIFQDVGDTYDGYENNRQANSVRLQGNATPMDVVFDDLLELASPQDIEMSDAPVIKMPTAPEAIKRIYDGVEVANIIARNKSNADKADIEAARLQYRERINSVSNSTSYSRSSSNDTSMLKSSASLGSLFNGEFGRKTQLDPPPTPKISGRKRSQSSPGMGPPAPKLLHIDTNLGRRQSLTRMYSPIINSVEERDEQAMHQNIDALVENIGLIPSTINTEVVLNEIYDIAVVEFDDTTPPSKYSSKSSSRRSSSSSLQPRSRREQGFYYESPATGSMSGSSGSLYEASSGKSSTQPSSLHSALTQERQNRMARRLHIALNNYQQDQMPAERTLRSGRRRKSRSR